MCEICDDEEMTQAREEVFARAVKRRAEEGRIGEVLTEEEKEAVAQYVMNAERRKVERGAYGAMPQEQANTFMFELGFRMRVAMMNSS